MNEFDKMNENNLPPLKLNEKGEIPDEFIERILGNSKGTYENGAFVRKALCWSDDIFYIQGLFDRDVVSGELRIVERAEIESIKIFIQKTPNTIIHKYPSFRSSVTYNVPDEVKNLLKLCNIEKQLDDKVKIIEEARIEIEKLESDLLKLAKENGIDE